MGTAAEATGTVSEVPGSVPDALILDEMFSPAIAADLVAHGIDCRAVAGDPVLRALSDLEIFQAALTEGRVLVTNNVQDFESVSGLPSDPQLSRVWGWCWGLVPVGEGWRGRAGGSLRRAPPRVPGAGAWRVPC